jgi:hypothetical protein
LVHWIASMIFRVPPALGALVVHLPPDPMVLLILVQGGVCRGLIDRHVRELFVVVLGT